MKGSDTTEGSKTSLSNKNSNEELEDEDEEEVTTVVDDDNNNGGGGIIISSPRHYIRSKTPRLRWTPDLHLSFLHAIERLGGQDGATPKLVLQMMNIKGLSIAHVKSHLQMYRSRKIDDPNQVMPDQGLLIDGEDQCIYNLSQLPILQSFNQRPTSTIRYGGASWSRHGLYGSFTERVFGINNGIKSCNSRFDHLGANSSSFNAKTTQQTRPPKLATTQLAERRKEQVSYLKNNIFSPEKGLWVTREGRSTMKRKTWERGINLELSLSLRGLTSRNDDHVDKFSNEDGKDDDDEVDNSLSLSLFPTSPSKLSRLKEGDLSGKRAKMEYTLDLNL